MAKSIAARQILRERAASPTPSHGRGLDDFQRETRRPVADYNGLGHESTR